MAFSPLRTVSRIIDATPFLWRMLGEPFLPGLVLVEAHLSSDPWVTVAHIVQRTGLTEDTVRRRLRELLSAGRANVIAGATRRLWSINPAFATRIIQGLAERGVPISTAA